MRGRRTRSSPAWAGRIDVVLPASRDSHATAPRPGIPGTPAAHIAVGGVIVLPLSGPVVTRIGLRRAVTVVALLIIAILMALSAAITGTTRRPSPEQRPHTEADTETRTAAV